LTRLSITGQSTLAEAPPASWQPGQIPRARMTSSSTIENDRHARID
jgi:hypothetical protein